MSSIRSHTATDIPALTALAERLAVMHRAMDPRRFNWTADLHSAYSAWFNSALTVANRVVFVAERDGVVVGYAMAEACAEDTAMWSPAHVFIHDIHIDESARRSGAAKSLVNAVSEWARARGFPQVRAITAISNKPAEEFFTSSGFRPAVTEQVLDLPE